MTGLVPATPWKRRAIRIFGCLAVGALASPCLADILIDHTFDGVANDVGPDFQEVNNGVGIGGLSDLTTFAWSEGLSWEMGGGKTRHEPDMSEWLGKRAGVGKRPP